MKKLIINVKLINKCKYKKGRIEKKDKSNKKKKRKNNIFGGNFHSTKD